MIQKWWELLKHTMEKRKVQKYMDYLHGKGFTVCVIEVVDGRHYIVDRKGTRRIIGGKRK